MRAEPPREQQPIHFTSPVFGKATAAASTYGSFSPPARPGNIVANRDSENNRREAELAQREREIAKKEMDHQQVTAPPPFAARTHLFLAACHPAPLPDPPRPPRRMLTQLVMLGLQFRGCLPLGGPPTDLRLFSSLWTLFGPPLYLEAPASWLSLLRRLWQFWAVSSALLLWNLLCIAALWSSGIARGRELLLAAAMLLALPPGAWLGWLLPICHYAHEQPGPPPYSTPPGGWRAICGLAVHVIFCGLAAMGPTGRALPGVLIAYDMFR